MRLDAFGFGIFVSGHQRCRRRRRRRRRGGGGGGGELGNFLG